jgi:hypothetical protein
VYQRLKTETDHVHKEAKKGTVICSVDVGVLAGDTRTWHIKHHVLGHVTTTFHIANLPYVYAAYLSKT